VPAADPVSRGLKKKLRKPDGPDGRGERPPVVLRDVVDWEQMLDLVEAFHDEGWAISIARTSDGGAIAIGLMVGGKPIKRYIATREGWQGLLLDLTE
jgi:hypothetical protein